MVQQKREKHSRSHKKLIIALVMIGVVILFDLTPLGGNIRFYTKWLTCGSRPVEVNSLPGIAWYEESPVFQLAFRNQSWYCTPIEAERAGYSASSNNHTYPHMDAAGESRKIFPD